MDGKRIYNGLLWKLLERFVSLGCQFIIQIILARLLGPNEYGTLAVMMTFIAIANVFIQNGFNTALIQNKSSSEDDYSSVLWVSEFIAVIVYSLIFLFAPILAKIYKMDQIIWPLRILALILFPGAFNSVQLAKVTKEMNFKIVFKSNFISVIVSGVCGIIAAYNNFGLWALVIQCLVNSLSVCLIMTVTANLKIRLYISFSRVKILFNFGWKLLFSSLLNNLTENIRGLAIGFKYDANALGYYNRGMQFPQYGTTVIQSTLQSVMLPAISEQQDNKNNAKIIMKNTIILSTYFVFPLMAGLAAVSESFIRLLLTDKWIDCVPYMKVYCIIFAFTPMFICNLQAMNAMGRSDLYLKLEIIKQSYSFITLFIALYFFNTPMAIAISSVLLIPLGIFFNCYPNKKLLDYGCIEQLLDMLPSIIMSIIMYYIVTLINYLSISDSYKLLLQIILGIVLYVIFSILFRVKAFTMVVNILHKKKGCK